MECRIINYFTTYYLLSNLFPAICKNKLHLPQGKAVFSANLKLAHVADIEQPHPGAHRIVLPNNAGIKYGHLPASKLHQPGSQLFFSQMFVLVYKDSLHLRERQRY